MTSIFQMIRQLIHMFRWWCVVMPWEQAVRVTFGKHARVLGSGWHWKLPLVHAVFTQSTRLRAMGVPTQTVSTRDGKTVTLSASVGFCINDILKLFQTLHNADSTIAQLVEIAIAQHISGHDLIDCKPNQVCDEAAKAVDLTRYGLGDIRISINTFAVVKTFRIINDQRYACSADLNTTQQDASAPMMGRP